MHVYISMHECREPPMGRQLSWENQIIAYEVTELKESGHHSPLGEGRQVSNSTPTLSLSLNSTSLQGRFWVPMAHAIGFFPITLGSRLQCYLLASNCSLLVFKEWSNGRLLFPISFMSASQKHKYINGKYNSILNLCVLLALRAYTWLCNHDIIN